MPALKKDRIPLFYRIFFTWVDPAISIPSIWAHFATPDFILDTYIPKAVSVRNPDHDMLFFHLAGSFMTIAVMSAVLLRYTSDLGVWRIVQAGIVLYDFEILYSTWHFLRKPGRLAPAVWRSEDWGNLVFIAVIIADVWWPFEWLYCS
ncbi:putative beta-mannosidase mnda [Diaporthe ampelina]|uniref:Putative beta-mannosidase mnda n=1 Tax=Diaporthe ampelina TaxID=1214573 RepID=A0A0G2HMV4_9PEZI|nr:putative beta-mannosidase mnda [Diaporthe ampelina]